MRISLVSTEKIVIVNGIQTRVWEGQIAGDTEAAGVKVYCYIPRVHVHPDEIPVNKQRAIKEMGNHLPPSPGMAKLPEVVNYDTVPTPDINPDQHYENNYPS